MKATVEFVTDPKTQAAEADMVVGVKVKDQPIPGRPAHLEVCEACHERIWISDIAPVGPPTRCYQCGIALMEEIEKEGSEIVLQMTESTTALFPHQGGKQ